MSAPLLLAVFVFWLPLVVGQSKAVPAADAGAYLGKTTTICGAISSLRRGDPGSKGGTLVDLDGEYPRQALTVVVSPAILKTFAPGFDDDAPHFVLCALGKVQRTADGLQIRVADARELRAVERGPTREPFPPTILRATDPSVVRPRLLKMLNPKYTSHAMRAKIQGTVEIEGVLRADGTIAEIRLIRSLDALFGLDAEAIRAFKQWRLAPATLNGQPVDVVVTGVLEFRLH